MPEKIVPESVLFDFDGVIIDSVTEENWQHSIAKDLHVKHELESIDPKITVEKLASDLFNAAKAVSYWTNSTSMERNPVELSDDMWIEYLTVDWHEKAKTRISMVAADIVREISERRYRRTLRPGIQQILEILTESGIPLAIVSNTPCGAITREFLREHNLSGYFQSEIYSNEVGIRKPNPDIIRLAASELGVSVEASWFVGDRLDRDIACAARASIAKSVLIESFDTGEYPYKLSVTPDLHVQNPVELYEFLQDFLS